LAGQEDDVRLLDPLGEQFQFVFFLGQFHHLKTVLAELRRGFVPAGGCELPFARLPEGVADFVGEIEGGHGEDPID